MALAVADVDDEPGLSDEQIEQLLQRAEARFQEDNKIALTSSDDFSVRLPKAPKIDSSKLPHPYVKPSDKSAHVDDSRLVDSETVTSANSIRRVEDPLITRSKKLEVKNGSAGPKWFNLPKANLTPELQRDLQFIKMRGVLDPHRHYKKENSKAPPPPFMQVGTLVEGPTEFFSGRLTNKERKTTLAEEIMANEREKGTFKRKYEEIQDKKTSGKRAHYKAQMAKKYKKNVKR